MRLKQYLSESEQVREWNKYVRDNKELSAAVKVLKQINKAGYKAYLVGGAVRDIILGNDCKDYDIATNAPMDELENMFKTYDIGKSKSFGIVVVKYGGFNFECAHFRQDGKYINGRRPESITVSGSFEQDAARRDFTINALGLNADGEIIDYFDGKKDIKNKVLRTVGDPRERFSEDYLRLMRLGRFASTLGFGIEKDTEKAAQDLSKNIKKLKPERIKDELVKAASQSGDKFANYIKILDKLKILEIILPEITKLKSYKEDPVHHPETASTGGTVYSHVIEALKKVGANQPIAMLATLLHDVGKGVTFSLKNGLPQYLNHAHEGIALVNNIADRLKMSNEERNALVFAVGNHMKFHNILDMRPSKIAKLVNDKDWDVLVAVAQADELSRGEMFTNKKEFSRIVDKAVEIKNKFGMSTVNKQLKLVDGNRVIELVNGKPGPKIGKVIRTVTSWIMDNDIKDQNEIDQKIKDVYNKL